METHNVCIVCRIAYRFEGNMNSANSCYSRGVILNLHYNQVASSSFISWQWEQRNLELLQKKQKRKKPQCSIAQLSRGTPVVSKGSLFWHQANFWESVFFFPEKVSFAFKGLDIESTTLYGT